MMDSKYLMVDQPLHVLGILVSRACTLSATGWLEQTNRATSGWG